MKTCGSQWEWLLAVSSADELLLCSTQQCLDFLSIFPLRKVIFRFSIKSSCYPFRVLQTEYSVYYKAFCTKLPPFQLVELGGKLYFCFLKIDIRAELGIFCNLFLVRSFSRKTIALQVSRSTTTLQRVSCTEHTPYSKSPNNWVAAGIKGPNSAFS